MSTPVYNQQPTVQNRPFGRKDANGNLIPDSFSDLAFLGEYTTTNLIYKGLARPGSDSADAVWQISFYTYDMSNNVISIQWPQDANGNSSNDYQFIWDNRASLTYS